MCVLDVSFVGFFLCLSSLLVFFIGLFCRSRLEVTFGELKQEKVSFGELNVSCGTASLASERTLLLLREKQKKPSLA